MPRKVSDYSRSTIYKLCCNDSAVSDVYVGSTTNFSKRKHSHKYSCNTTSSKKHNLYVYQFIRANGGWDAWDMVQIEAYNATTKRDLEARERHWLEKLGATLNKKVPTRTKKEYRDDKKEAIKETNKKWRDENEDKIKEYQKKWNAKNKEKNREYQKKHKAKQFAMKLHEFIHS